MKKTANGKPKIIFYVLPLVLALIVPIFIHVLVLKCVPIHSDSILRGIAVREGDTVSAYAYVPREESKWYRAKLYSVQMRSSFGNGEYIDQEAYHASTLQSVGKNAVTEDHLLQKYNHIALVKDIIPSKDFIEIEILLDEPDAEFLQWEQTPDSSFSYAYCDVYFRGIVKGSAYDYMFGRMRSRERQGIFERAE